MIYAFKTYPLNSPPPASSQPQLAKIDLAFTKEQLDTLAVWAAKATEGKITRYSKGDLLIGFLTVCLNVCYEVPVQSFMTVINVSGWSTYVSRLLSA
jgi:hypothetical protein